MDSPPSSEASPAGVVLAAGWGRRIGGPKALLRTPDGRTFLETVVSRLRDAGIARMVVVVGPWWNPREAVPGCDVVVNPDPDRGVISSLRLAIWNAGLPEDPPRWSDPGRGVVFPPPPTLTPTPTNRPATRGPTGCLGILVALVDHPAVRAQTVRTLVEAHRREPDRIVVPTFAETGRRRRGHPVVFPAWAVPEFFASPADREGPRAVVRAHPQAVAEVEVPDPGVVMDVDSPACYQEWLEASAPGALARGRDQGGGARLDATKGGGREHVPDANGRSRPQGGKDAGGTRS